MRFRSRCPRDSGESLRRPRACRDAGCAPCSRRCDDHWRGPQWRACPRAVARAVAAVRLPAQGQGEPGRLAASPSASSRAPVVRRMSFACAGKAKRGAGIPSPLLGTRWGSAGSTDAGGPDLVHRLFGRCLRHRLYRYEDAALGFRTELDLAVDEREQGVVLAKADILARVPLSAALAGNDVAGDRELTAEQLQTQPLAVRVAAVARGAACFLVCHGIDSFSPELCSSLL